MKSKFAVGDLVVVNNLEDATLWRIVDKQGSFGIGLIDATIEKTVPNQQVQWIDIGSLKKPNTMQLLNFINSN